MPYGYSATYTVTFAVLMSIVLLWVLNAVVRKQQNVKAAITLSVKAKIVFKRERNVFILTPVSVTVVCFQSDFISLHRRTV